MTAGGARTYSSRSFPVLGSELHLLVTCASPTLADRVEHLVHAEIDRLDAILSTYRDTPLSRWMQGTDDDVPGEVITVLALARDWFRSSGGAFNPALGKLRRRWADAERTGRPPNHDESRRLVAEAARLPFTVEDGPSGRRLVRTADCTSLDVDALAKGWVIDRAAEAGFVVGVQSLLVNIGGDLRFVGTGSTRVAVEDPRESLDNVAPLTVVTLTSGALASSGNARRGFRVGDHWWGHVLDPRSGRPVEQTAGATVIARDAATADALATVVGLEGIDHPTIVSLLDRHDAAAMVALTDGTVRTTDDWLGEGGGATGDGGDDPVSG